MVAVISHLANTPTLIRDAIVRLRKYVRTTDVSPPVSRPLSQRERELRRRRANAPALEHKKGHYVRLANARRLCYTDAIPSPTLFMS